MSWFSKRQALTSINHYSRKDTNHHIKGSDTPANRRTLVIVPIAVDIDDRLGSGRLDRFTTLVDTEMDLNTAANWDTVTPTDYTVPVTRAGKDFYIYACMQAGSTPKLLLSANSTYPSGYTANNSRKIGGFHAMPYVTAPTWRADTVTTVNYVVQPVTPGATKLLYRCTARAGDYKTDAATEPTWPTVPGETVVDDQVTWTCDANGCENLVAGHPYTGFLMGDIHLNSVWDLISRPRASPEGMAKCTLTPSTLEKAKWCDIYQANGTGTTNSSVCGATVATGVTWHQSAYYASLLGKRLLTDLEFEGAAYGGNEQTILNSGIARTYSIFPVDSAGKSMISYYGMISMCGANNQWIDAQSFRLGQDGTIEAAAQVAAITYVASLEGAAVYLKWNGPVPYLCADIAADLWITAGSYKFQIKADADPSTGGSMVYFRDTATAPNRLYSTTATGLKAFIPTSHPGFVLSITHHAAPATMGVELRYDNVTHNRLEAINAGGVNANIDLATYPGEGWIASGGSGQPYVQGSYGLTKVCAGGTHSDATIAGSRHRNCVNLGTYTSSTVAGRYASDPV